ncbi:asparaginase [Staphylococcus chromogenes]|uniref:asparaginase n=1 Tax=Staphylococcus chromogenes TaxID=46126 RepID=UPI000D1AE006|nr:asparaginase [Staphylococcus chromogenes]PTF68102.1 L-asparaginase [Staphylococcus chromogenes]PTF72979.1 L-asparaginase [Staphylococcus chromogenes]PTG09508.1 L-asparaginase [Staphylococcus chromogenes]PTG81410.1 L-asparaginase [Staphylococcus chromogenes]PUZ24095.1 asparaginase [Staphylococcus chromogenes]
MKSLLVIHTGGTISMSEDESNRVLTNDENPIAQHQSLIKKYAHIEEVMPFNVPSPHITLSHVKELISIIEHEEQNSNYDGYVITHGTDTLEETAYLLDLTVETSKPIILTGAMRSSNEIGSDGLYNFISAIRVAIHDDSQHKGVMVVFNDEIHTARNVTKTHTSNTNTFQSPNHGPLGVITKSGVLFHHRPYRQTVFPNINVSLNVPLIKAHMGLGSEMLTYYANTGVDGIVIEALGQGNLPPTAMKGLETCLAQNIPIVLVSRSFNGIVSAVYAYEGGGHQLSEKGVIFSNGLNGQKARLKLLVALSNKFNKAHIKTYFNY